MITEKEAMQIMGDNAQEYIEAKKNGEIEPLKPLEYYNYIMRGIPPYYIRIGLETYYGTREEAIELGVMRDPNKPLTLRERITEKIQNWHSRMAVWHERRSIGLR